MTLGDSSTGVTDIIFDGEVPRSFTGRARQALSGGQFVTVSGGAQVIGANSALFNPGSIIVDLPTADLNQIVGIVLHNVGSNGIVSVATRGTYITRAGGLVSGGYPVAPASGTIQHVVPVLGIGGSVAAAGRAITAAASGTANYLLVNYSF